ncbi:CHAT domain-containing protein [Massilia frigida]|nr:CHAT domain-containing protein [Massilia frigida]
MSYLLEARGPAYQYYRLNAFYGNNYALANRLGSMFFAKYCADMDNASFTCFTVITQTAFNYYRLGDSVSYRATLQLLDKALARHPQLQLALMPVSKVSGADTERRKKALVELRSYVPDMDRLFDGNDGEWGFEEMERIAANLMQAQAVGYWIARADGKHFPRIAKAMAAAKDEEMSEEDWAAVLISMAYLSAAALNDYDILLASVNAMRDLYAALAAAEEVKIDLTPFDLMKLGALYSANQLKEARQLVKTIRNSPALRSPHIDAVPAPLNVLSSCHAAANFAPNEDADQVMPAKEYLLSKIAMKIGLKMGERVPTAAVRSIMEYEARELFAKASGMDEARQAFLPSDFVANWPDYSKVFAGDHVARTRLAQAAKCLLARPEIVMRLGQEFVNKGSKERQTLNAAIFTMLADSGTFQQHSNAIGNEDFVLLQAASIMQAHNGISSATARSVFASVDVRNSIQEAELGMVRLSDQFNVAAKELHLSDMVRRMSTNSADGLEKMMSSMMDHPAEYARYAELRNQSIATLAEVKKALTADDAAMLLTLFDDTLVSVVVRHDSARIVSTKVSRNAMKNAVAKLKASTNFLSQQSTRLPPAYRADIAWQLYKQLFKPVEALLAGARTVYLVAGEDLALIPFSALVTAAPPAQSAIDFSTYRRLRWLGDRLAFVSLPSVHSLLKTSAANDRENPRLLGVGNPEVAMQMLIDLRLSPMPDTASLLDRVRKPGDPAPLLRAQANYGGLEAASNSAILSSGDMALINSHALAAGESAKYGTQEPAILLAPTSQADVADFLDPSKVMSLKLSLRLIMLLACETAGGRTIDNAQPYAGLVNSFFFAGADSVVATNLPVDPAVAEDFAVNFLRYVRDGKKSSAMALQMAAADVRCANDSMACAEGDKYVWAHPAYWSQFTLVGSGR